MTLENLVLLSVKIEWRKKMMNSVTRIQKWWMNRHNRPPNPLKIFSKMLKELKAAIRIQRWRKLLIFRDGKRIILRIQNRAAKKIQRALRRTILRTNAELINHVYVCSSYFNKMREEMLTDFQVKIAYHWRKFWVRK